MNNDYLKFASFSSIEISLLSTYIKHYFIKNFDKFSKEKSFKLGGLCMIFEKQVFLLKKFYLTHSNIQDEENVIKYFENFSEYDGLIDFMIDSYYNYLINLSDIEYVQFIDNIGGYSHASKGKDNFYKFHLMDVYSHER